MVRRIILALIAALVLILMIAGIWSAMIVRKALPQS